MSAARLFFLILALGFIPFGVTTYNGATAAGIVSILIFILLTVVEARGGWVTDDETSERLDAVDREIGR